MFHGDVQNNYPTTCGLQAVKYDVIEKVEPVFRWEAPNRD
jgi:hypothetical protein